MRCLKLYIRVECPINKMLYLFCLPFLAWCINLTWLELYETNYVCENAWNNQWVIPFTCPSYTNIMFIMFSQCWWVDLHVERLRECCQHMSNTKMIKNFQSSSVLTKKNYIAFVAPCYQPRKQGATTLYYKSLSSYNIKVEYDNTNILSLVFVYPAPYRGCLLCM